MSRLENFINRVLGRTKQVVAPAFGNEDPRREGQIDEKKGRMTNRTHRVAHFEQSQPTTGPARVAAAHLLSLSRSESAFGRNEIAVPEISPALTEK